LLSKDYIVYQLVEFQRILFENELGITPIHAQDVTSDVANAGLKII